MIGTVDSQDPRTTAKHTKSPIRGVLIILVATLGIPHSLPAADGWPNRGPDGQDATVDMDYWSADLVVALDKSSGSSQPSEPLSSDSLSIDDTWVDSCDNCGGRGGLDCNACGQRWFDNTEAFIAGDGWKNIFDDDDNNNFGFRTGVNLGIALPGPSAVRGQTGASYGGYDFHGRESLLSRDDPIEQQIFVTAGLYKRSDVARGDSLAWGVVYDVMDSRAAGERADRLRLAQLRSYVGWAISERNEVGIWSAFRLMNDYAIAQRVRVNTTDQVNAFWHRNWCFGGDTVGYVGWADDPGSVVIGLTARAPLNHRFALLGNVQYIVPSTTGGDIHPTLGTDDIFNQEAWNVSFGLVFYPGAKAAPTNVSGYQGLPLLPVADNGSFTFQAPLFCPRTVMWFNCFTIWHHPSSSRWSDV